MAVKWALAEPQNFDDIANIVRSGSVPIRFFTVPSARRPVTCDFPLYFDPSESVLSHDFLVKALRADNWQFLLTFEQSAQLLAEHSAWAFPEHVTKIEPVAKSAFEEGKKYFERNKELLTRRYEGKYIAIWKNDVLDSDTSFSSLAQRVYQKLGYVSIYMPFVSSKRRVLRFESPERRSKANAS